MHLFSQARGKLRYPHALGAFLPAAPLSAVRVAGTASGDLDFDACVIGARDATIGTAHNLGKTSGVLPSGSSPTPSASTSESIRDFRHRVF